MAEPEQAHTLSSPSLQFLRERAEECVALSDKVDDPKNQAAILRLASSWMRLAQFLVDEESERKHCDPADDLHV